MAPGGNRKHSGRKGELSNAAGSGQGLGDRHVAPTDSFQQREEFIRVGISDQKRHCIRYAQSIRTRDGFIGGRVRLRLRL